MVSVWIYYFVMLWYMLPRSDLAGETPFTKSPESNIKRWMRLKAELSTEHNFIQLSVNDL